MLILNKNMPVIEELNGMINIKTKNTYKNQRRSLERV